MNASTVKVEIKSVSYYPVKSSLKEVKDHTYITYLLNGRWGDLEIEKHTEDLQEIIELILEEEKGRVQSALIGEYEVEL